MSQGMTNGKRKGNGNLDARVKAFNEMKDRPGMKFHKPGSGKK